MKKSYLLLLLLLAGCAASAPKQIELEEPVAQFESANDSKTVLRCVRQEWLNIKWRVCSAAEPILIETEQGADLYTQLVVDGSWSVITGVDHEQGSTIAIHIDRDSALGCDVQTPFEAAIGVCK